MQIGQVVVSGGSGMIGSSLLRELKDNRIYSIQLTRRDSSSKEAVRWDPYAAEPVGDLSRLNDLDAAVHLSGANVSSNRWTAAYKQEILRSRVVSTRAISGLLARLKQPPRVLICASAIGIYGDRGDELLTEESGAGRGFLAETCQAWEAATQAAEDAGIRVVHARIGLVLAPGGGVLGKLVPLFRTGLGGKLGSGRQWQSWVSLRDLVRIFLRAMEDDALRGPVNVTAPGAVTNAEFTKTLGRVLHRPAIATAPAFALRLAVGQMADEALLASARVEPRRLLDCGFEFQDPSLEPALRSML